MYIFLFILEFLKMKTYVSKLRGNLDNVTLFNDILEKGLERINKYVTVKAKIVDIKYKILNVCLIIF